MDRVTDRVSSMNYYQRLTCSRPLLLVSQVIVSTRMITKTTNELKTVRPGKRWDMYVVSKRTNSRKHEQDMGDGSYKKGSINTQEVGK